MDILFDILSLAPTKQDRLKMNLIERYGVIACANGKQYSRFTDLQVHPHGLLMSHINVTYVRLFKELCS